MLSREALFLLNNLLFMGILVVCFWGVIFPMISELVTGQKITVGPPFYERVTGPLFAGLVLLMGVAPLRPGGSFAGAAWAGCLVAVRPLVGALVSLVLLLSGMRQPGGRCLGFWLAALVALVTLYRVRARRAGAPSRPRREPAVGAVESGRAQPAALWRLRDPPGRRADGHRHHRASRCSSRRPRARWPAASSLPWARYVMIYDGLHEFMHADGREHRPGA